MLKYSLPNLPYPYDALEPFVDSETMEIHHDKHHAAYVNNLNALLEKYPDLPERPLEVMMKDIEKLPFSEQDRIAFRNNGGGHLNHSFFWTIMAPQKEVDEKLLNEVVEKFGSLEEFKKQFNEAAKTRFGSGWGWLARGAKNELKIYSTANQDSPYLNGDTPLIGIDVWEHAYYLKYQNRRPEYVENWWNVLKLL